MCAVGPGVGGSTGKSFKAATQSEQVPIGSGEEQILVESEVLVEPTSSGAARDSDPVCGDCSDPHGKFTVQFPAWKRRAQVKSATAKQHMAASKRTLHRQPPQAAKVPRTGSKPSPRKRNSAAQWDNQDRMFDRAEFSKLQRMIGLKFTLDACSNPNGSNALVPECFKSQQDSFLDYDCTGHTVWLNPPYADVTPFLRHYCECKARSPHTTSAVVVLPKWKGAHCAYLKGMQVIKEYPKGTRLFSGPPGPGTTERQPLGPTPWPVQVYYDPPVAMPLSCAAALDDGGEGPDQFAEYSESDLDCVHVDARVAGANARGLIDSGANQSLLSARYCRANGVVITPAPQAVELADGKRMQVSGVCNVRIQIGQYKAVHKCWVAHLHPAYDLILGRTWMKLSGAIIDATCNKLSVLTSKGRVVLQRPTDAAAPASAGESPMRLLSVLQAKRATRKNTDSVLVFVGKADESKLVATTTDGLVPPVQLQQILDSNRDVFSEDIAELPPDRGDQENIINLLPGATPKSVPQYRLTKTEKEAITEYVKELLAKKLIEPSSSPWGAPVLFVPKKTGEGWKGLRLCIDYRLLNKQTIRNSFPLPRIDDLVDQLGQAKVFSSLDLTSGYWQCRLTDSDRPKTAFRTPFGLFQWRVAPMGLCNSPARFQSIMNRIFQPLLNKCVTVYLDDILVFSRTPEEHTQHLQQVFDILRANKFVLKQSKCCFNLPEVHYLGHVVGRDGVKVDPAKIRAVEKCPRPETVTQVRSFLGFVNYFRRFIDRYADVSRPLNELLHGARKKHARVVWTADCQKAFDTLKQLLVTAPVLAVPDFSKPFEIEADASDFCMGAVLLQDGHPIAYESRTFIPAERRYGTGERELCAVVHALKVWRCYLWGNRFTIKSDHEPLKYLQSKGTLSPRQARWSELLSAYDYVWVYKKGSTMIADALSRLPESPAGGAAACAAVLPPADPHTPLYKLIAAETAKDSWFASPKSVRGLVKRGPCWYKGSKLVVPQALRLQVMEELHDAPYSGHRGVTKTLALLGKTYWWPKMRAEVTHHVRTCAVCQVMKSRSVKPGGQLQPLPIPEDRWEAIAMDFITDLPCTRAGHDAILVFVDRLTRMVLFAPCTKDTDAVGTAKLLRDYVFCNHGLPQSIVSDRDSRFTSKVWTELMRLLGTRLDMSSAFHPQTDGLTERYNRVLEEYLRSYVSATYDDWDEWLPMAQFAINNSKQESLNATPFFLNFGRHPRTPASLITQSDTPGAEEFAASLHAAIKKAKSALHAAQQRQKALADGKRRDVQFNVGEEVALDSRNLTLKTTGPNKLLPKYVGPFKVLQKVGKVAYKLDLPPTMKCHPVFHVSLLHKYHRDGRTQPHPPPIAVDDEGEWFVVEGVLDHKRVRRGRRWVDRYLVKWAGYGPEHNQWRDAEEVTPEAIQAFLDSRKSPAPRRCGRRRQ